MDNCSFSRFDAHLGVKDVSLTNCEFGHQGVRMVGCGTMLIENCDIHHKSLIFLRDDYGSSWEGDLIVRNCNLIAPENSKTVYLLNGRNKGKHDFGYTCYLPKRFEVENLVIDDSKVTHKDYTGPAIFGTFHRNVDEEGLYPYIAKGVVDLNNVKVVSGRTLCLSRNPDLFKYYTIIEN